MKTYYLAVATMAVVTAVAAADVRASEPTINVTPTNYCEYLGSYTLLVGTDRDQGMSKRDAVGILVTDGAHIESPLADDMLTAIDLVYLVDLASPSEVASIMYDTCQENRGKPL